MKREYKRLTNMAWYALQPFVNTLDCSQRYGELVIAQNDNSSLESIFNGDLTPEGLKLRPYYFGKFRLEMHLSGAATYYYRSKAFSPARTGYGGYEKAHKKLDFAQEMGISGKCQKSNDTCVMLLGIDIDAKHDEPDAAEVSQMLLELFPGSYHEPSTGGNGIHFYLKTFYDTALRQTQYQTVKHVHDICTDLGAVLERLRLDAGYQAPIDKVRSHPSLLSYDSNTERIRVQCRSICIKIPRFTQGEDDVLRFHTAPYVDFRYLEELVREAKEKDLAAAPELHITNGEEKLNQAYLLSSQDADDGDDETRGEGGGVCSNSVCTSSYEDLIKNLQSNTDAHERTVGLALAYARHIRRIPTVDEMLKEYQAQGLNTGADEDGNRRRRMQVMYDYHLRTFDPSKLGFNLEGYDEEKDIYLSVIRDRITSTTNLTYQQNRTRHITIEDLARLYFAMCRSQGKGTSTAFSISQVQNAMKKLAGKKGSPHRASRMLGLLQELRLIEQVGGYIPGIRGKAWCAQQPAQPQSAH